MISRSETNCHLSNIVIKQVLYGIHSSHSITQDREVLIWSYLHVSCVTRKCALRSLSLSYPKKDWRAGPRQSFFGYDTDCIKCFGKIGTKDRNRGEGVKLSLVPKLWTPPLNGHFLVTQLMYRPRLVVIHP